MSKLSTRVLLAVFCAGAFFAMQACDSSGSINEQEPTLAELWEGRYSGMATVTRYYSDSPQETEDSLDCLLIIAFQNESTVDSIYLEYSSVESTTPEADLVSRDSIYNFYEADDGDITLEVALKRDGDEVTGKKESVLNFFDYLDSTNVTFNVTR